MTDVRFRELISRLTAAYPEVRHALRPYGHEDLPGVEGFLYVLNVPDERLAEVEDFAIGTAMDLWGEEVVPFLVSAVGPENTRLCFPVTETESVTIIQVGTETATRPEVAESGSTIFGRWARWEEAVVRSYGIAACLPDRGESEARTRTGPPIPREPERDLIGRGTASRVIPLLVAG